MKKTRREVARVFALCYSMRMRPLKSLTLESIISLLEETFSQIEDARDPNRIDYSLHDTLMSGFAMFFFQHPSLLQFQEAMEKKRGLSNLQTIFGVHQVPSETQMREVLDSASPEQSRRLLPTLFELVRRAGWATDYKISFRQGCSVCDYYTVALDGTEYFNSSAINCESCLQTRDKSGVIRYHHSVVAATSVRAGSHLILPLDAEMVANTDGTVRQDCEINAAKRLIERLRQEDRQMKIILSRDDLYSRAPFIDQCKANRLHFVFVAKPESHKELFEWVEDLSGLGELARRELARRACLQAKIFQLSNRPPCAVKWGAQSVGKFCGGVGDEQRRPSALSQ